MSDEAIILQPIGVTKSSNESGLAYYQIIGESKDKKYFMTFAVKSCYEESTDKVLKRFCPIKVEENKDGKEDNIDNGTASDDGTDSSSKCEG